jgi:CTP:molybdopterin cytidylyltransferase MocA
MRIAAVILAAGASSRFGSPKQDVPLGGRRMLDVVIGIARDAGLAPIIAVVPRRLHVPADVAAVVNDAPADGLSRSLRLGIAAVPSDVDGAVVLLGDQPTLDPAVIRALIAVRADRPIVAAFAGGHYGPPVLVRREAFGLVDAGRGDTGLRDVLEARPELVTALDVGVHAADVDRPDDLGRIAHMFDSSADR